MGVVAVVVVASHIAYADKLQSVYRVHMRCNGYNAASQAVTAVRVTPSVAPVSAASPTSVAGKDKRASYQETGIWSCVVCYYTQVCGWMSSAHAVYTFKVLFFFLLVFLSFSLLFV